MIERDINMWELIGVVDVICITTNGVVTKDGRCVMGRGNALQAKEMFPNIDIVLGSMIRNYGNIPQLIWNVSGTCIYSFPVKVNWKHPADLSLIDKSINSMVKIANQNRYRKIVLPKPGCQNGKLEWCDVKKLLKAYILHDDRFVIVGK